MRSATSSMRSAKRRSGTTRSSGNGTAPELLRGEEAEMPKYTCADDLDVRLWGRIQYVGECWVWTGGKSHGYGHIMCEHRVWKVHRLTYTMLVGPVPDDLELDHLCRNRACCNPDHLEPVTGRVNTLRGDTITGRNARATHCKRGHPFDRTNTFFKMRGNSIRRVCRACARTRCAAHGRKVRIERRGPRDCDHCGKPIPNTVRLGARFCSRHCKSLGRPSRATPGSHLTPEEVRDIRRLSAEGLGYRKIAPKFDVSPGTVALIIQGKTWRHID